MHSYHYATYHDREKPTKSQNLQMHICHINFPFFIFCTFYTNQSWFLCVCVKFSPFLNFFPHCCMHTIHTHRLCSISNIRKIAFKFRSCNGKKSIFFKLCKEMSLFTTYVQRKFRYSALWLFSAYRSVQLNFFLEKLIRNPDNSHLWHCGWWLKKSITKTSVLPQ